MIKLPRGKSQRLHFNPVNGGDDRDGRWTIVPARYSVGAVCIQTPSSNGYKTRAARLADALATRYTHREHAYVLTPSRAEEFQRLFEKGWDANFVSRELQPPRD